MNLKTTNEHRAIISFQRHGVVVGTLNLEAKPPTFTGDFDESAKLFIAAILKMMPRLVPVEESDTLRASVAELEETNKTLHSLMASGERRGVEKATEEWSQRVKELEAKVKRLTEALVSIEEYWNRNQNEVAMADACWHAVNTATEALGVEEAKSKESP